MQTPAAVFCVLFTITAFCQAPDTLWTRTFGQASDDRGMSAQFTSDGGYIIGGYTYVAGGGGYNFYLVKTNPNGDTVWTQSYGGPSADYGTSVRQTNDGGYVMVGYSYSFSGVRPDVYVVKTDPFGNVEWDYPYGDTVYDSGSDIQQTMDGGYIITGITCPQVMGVEELLLLKLDSLGDTLWTRTYGTMDSDGGAAIIQTPDSGYVITGCNGASASYSLWILKTDVNGAMLWSKVYSPGNYAWGTSIDKTNDGGYVVCGSIFGGSGETDFWLLKTDAQGDTLWARPYGGPSMDDALSVKQTNEGGYVMAGRTYSYGAGLDDVYIVRTDSTGDTLWTKTYGGTGADYGSSIDLTPDGGYIIAGCTESFGAGYEDVWLLRIESDPFCIHETRTGRCEFAYIQATPNPFSGQTQIRCSMPAEAYSRQDTVVNMKIYDSAGRLVKSFDPESSIENRGLVVLWDGTDDASRKLPGGVYFVTLQSAYRTETIKIILVK